MRLRGVSSKNPNMKATPFAPITAITIITSAEMSPSFENASKGGISCAKIIKLVFIRRCYATVTSSAKTDLMKATPDAEIVREYIIL